jgi:predicted kinase
MSALIIVSGPPCAGKSTLANRLREELKWPLLAKDPIKELLFDSVGWRDRAWSRKLSEASYAMLFNVAAELMHAGQRCIIEGNFRWRETARRFGSLLRPELRVVQICCTAPLSVLSARLHTRIAAGHRHPGHLDVATVQEIEAELPSFNQPLPIAGSQLVFDSTQPERLAMDKLLESVRALL